MPSIEKLLQLLAQSPEDDFVLYGLAIEHAKAGEHDRAVEFFDRAIRADPDNAYHYFHKARSLESLERIDEALATLDRGRTIAKQTDDDKAISEITGYIEMIQTNWSRN